MASITESEVFRNRLLADGRRRIRYKYVIEDNQTNTKEYFVGPFHRLGDWDVDGNLSAYGDALLEDLKNNEVQKTFKLAQTIEEEIDSLAALQTEILANVDDPQYTIKKRLQKKLIYYLMRRGDAQYALNVKAVYDDLPATDAGKRNRLDITQAQLNKLKNKVAEFYGIPGSAKSGVTIITGAFISESEEWGEA